MTTVVLVVIMEIIVNLVRIMQVIIPESKFKLLPCHALKFHNPMTTHKWKTIDNIKKKKKQKKNNNYKQK